MNKYVYDKKVRFEKSENGENRVAVSSVYDFNCSGENTVDVSDEVLFWLEAFVREDNNYQKLKEGGEVTMLPSFAKEDYGEFLKQAKKMDIPVAAIREQGKDNTLSVFFNVKDKEAVNSIVQGIVREKMKAPEQTQRMITIEKEQVEGFQAYCSEHDIPVNFMETKSDVKCIFNFAYEKQIAAAVENYRQVQNELSKSEIKVQADIRGRPKIIVNDFESGKKLTVNFCPKSKLERILRERLGFNNVKTIEAARSAGSIAAARAMDKHGRDNVTEISVVSVEEAKTHAA